MLEYPARRMPRVSIGMPVYNMAGTIESAVKSLLRQTFTDFELVIADNASTDGTQEVCRELVSSDARIRYVRHEANRGGATNFLFLFESTGAPYFMWAAADDLWAPAFLETAVRSLDEHPHAPTAFCRVNVFDAPQGDYVHEDLVDLGMVPLYRRAARFVLQRDNLGKANLIYGVHRRSALLHTLHCLSLPIYGEDMVLVFELLLQGPLCISPERLFSKRYRENPASFTGAFGYLVANFTQCAQYVRCARRKHDAELAAWVTLLAVLKYSRDFVIWSGSMRRALVRRLRRFFAERAVPHSEAKEKR